MSNGDGLSQRELLLEVREVVSQIQLGMADKADRKDIDRLEDRLVLIDRDGSHGLHSLAAKVADHETRLKRLERYEAAGEAVVKYRKWFAPLLLSGAGLLTTAAGLILAFH